MAKDGVLRSLLGGSSGVDITERRRQVANETQEPGARVSKVATRHGICERLVFSWRRQAREGVLVSVEMPILIPADSSGRRNRRFVGRSKQLVKRLRRGSPIERLSGPRIEGCCHGCNLFDTAGAKIGTFWEVLASQPVGVLIGAVLPRTARITEVDLRPRRS